MMTLIPTAIVLLTLTSASGSSPEPAAPVQWRAEVMSSNEGESAAVSSLLRTLNARVYAENQWAQASQTVFVVPGPHSPVESLVQITEDMVVMCRILDKAIAPLLTISDRGGAFNDPFVGQTPDGRPQTQGLYLDGYGALFFVEVGFPLVRPAEEQEHPEPEQGADPVWSQTVDELKGIPPKQSGARVPPYKAERVQDLKGLLVMSLRHAANLRVRGAQDRIALVVTTRSQSGSYGYVGRGSRSTVWGEQAGNMSSDVLILGTTKPDVDAFARGDLTLEQFTQKVNTIRSWTGSAQQSTTSRGIVQPSSGISISRQR